ncbi:MAG: hypothetical protein KAS12_03990 [Candidatus Aenigmarchaeota archaeon]|nr:hypothetical protein [Candidatus Aenigmarchaeota archaeon]
MEIIPSTTECSKLVPGDSTVCTSCKVVKKIKDELNITADNDIKIIQDAKKILKCDNESCVLKTLECKLGANIVRDEFEKRFLPEGPKNTDDLLSNIDIDMTLRQWSLVHKNFFPFPFAMIDFASYGHPIATIDIEQMRRDKISCFAVVINTDIMSGPGKHWVAIFGDMRGLDEWTLEFFNSSGNSPGFEIVDWMSKTAMKMAIVAQPDILKVKYFQTGELRHQQSKTECGVYSLYYIYSRICGIPYSYFATTRIKDVDMYKFRKELFRV